MRRAKTKPSVLIGLLFSCLEMIFSANTGFSMSVYNVTSQTIYLRWLKFSGATSYRVTATAGNAVCCSLVAHFSDVALKGTLTALIPNTIYAIQAEAVDKNGITLAETQVMQSTGFCSVISTELCRTGILSMVSHGAVPCAPGHLLVSWSSVRFGDYYVVFVKSDDGLEAHCNTSHTQCRFQSDCGFTFSISVFAYNKAGQSPSGDVFNYTTAPCRREIKNISKEALSVISVHWQSNNEAATYIATARGEAGLWHCASAGNSCTIINLARGAAFSVSAVARSPAGESLPSYSVPLETAPCCPHDLILTRVTQSVTNVSWSVGMGAQTYVTALDSPKGQAKCHTLQNYCLLGCITCGTNYTVSLTAISETGLTSSCTHQGYSSST